MKIYLQAFGGKLKSGVQEWPEGTALDVYLPLDMDSNHFFGNSGQVITTNVPVRKMGKFTWNGKYVWVGNDSARLYVLNDIS